MIGTAKVQPSGELRRLGEKAKQLVDRAAR
jgi:hypothetical protein